MSSSTRSPERAKTGYIQPMLLDSDFKNLALVRKWLRSVALEVGLSPCGEGDLQVAVGEAVTNCIKHAYTGTPGGKILIYHSVVSGGLTIHIRDWGKTFARDSYQEPDLSEPREGGYGVYLMRRLTDHVEISTDRPPGTEISLTKKISGIGPEQSSMMDEQREIRIKNLHSDAEE